MSLCGCQLIPPPPPVLLESKLGVELCGVDSCVGFESPVWLPAPVHFQHGILIVSQTCLKFCYIRIQDNFVYFISVLLSSQCNDQALAYIERARASTLDTPWLRIWQNMLAYPISKGAAGMRLGQRQPVRRRRPWL